MNYKKYIKARNASWQILIDCDVRDLPVDVFDICKKLHIKVVSYDSCDGREIIKYLDLAEVVKTTDGLCISAVPEKPVILYDDKTSRQRQRFTIAHELGHILLGHGAEANGILSFRNSESCNTEHEEKEREANVFASRLLCPACVLWKKNVHTWEKIAQLCDVSKEAAEYRFERMQLLYARNKFLTNPLEKEVIKNFEQFIFHQ